MKKPKTVFGYPAPTFVVLLFLAFLAAAVSWLRLFYHPPIPATTPSPSLPDLPKVVSPQLPESAISPLTLGQVQLPPATLSLPQTAPIFTTSVSTPLSAVASQTARALSLTSAPTPSGQQIQIWKGPSTTFIFDPQKGIFSYFVTPYPTLGKAPTPDLASTSAQKFLEKIGLTKPGVNLTIASTAEFSVSGFDLIPFSAPDKNEPTSATKSADIIELSYALSFENSPLVVNRHEFPVQIKVGRNNKVVSFLSALTPENPKKQQEYWLISPNDIIPLLKSGQGSLISFEPSQYGQTPFSNSLSQFNIVSVAFAYYYSPKQDLLYPSLLIKGDGLLSDQTRGQVTFLLPAVNPAYYK